MRLHCAMLDNSNQHVKGQKMLNKPDFFKKPESWKLTSKLLYLILRTWATNKKEWLWYTYSSRNNSQKSHQSPIDDMSQYSFEMWKFHFDYAKFWPLQKVIICLSVICCFGHTVILEYFNIKASEKLFLFWVPMNI